MRAILILPVTYFL